MYGRAKGKALRARQAEQMRSIYPKLEIDLRNPLKPDSFDRTWLELGFGGAEHLIWQAAQNPDVLVLGAEPFINGVAKAVSAIDEQGLSNVRLYQGDGREVMDAIPDGALDRLFVLFPDPWPKSRHNKRRIITPEFLQNAHRIIRAGGQFRFASDIIDYVDWTLTRVHHQGGFDWTPQSQADWRIRPDDWPQTRYEAKAIREGRAGHFFKFVRR